MGVQRTVPGHNMMWQVLDSVENRRIGLLKSQQYHRKMCRLLGDQLRATESRKFAKLIRAEDADVRGDRLAVLNTLQMAQFDVVHRAGDQEHEYARLYEQEFPVPGRRVIQSYATPLIACIRWSPAGAMYTMSGTVADTLTVQVMDEATATAVETLDCSAHSAKGIFTHEHSRLNPALIGIGTDLTKVFIADLRTGNMTASSGTKHSGSIHGLGWSLTDEHKLVSACTDETFLWDVRHFSKKPLLQLPCYQSGRFIPPQIQFLDANRLLIMSDTRKISVCNVNNGTLLDTIEVSYRANRRFSRFKFALNREANTVYYASKRALQRYNLDTKKIEMEAKGGHVWPIEMILFNDYTKELYTMNNELEAIVWTPFR